MEGSFFVAFLVRVAQVLTPLYRESLVYGDTDKSGAFMLQYSCR